MTQQDIWSFENDPRVQRLKADYFQARNEWSSRACLYFSCSERIRVARKALRKLVAEAYPMMVRATRNYFPWAPQENN